MMSEIVARLTAAKDKLMTKGYECPAVEIGCKVLGDYGAVFWGTIHLGSPGNHTKDYTHDTLEAALDDIEASADRIPAKSVIDTEKASALSKLSEQEQKLLGINRLRGQ